MQGEFWSLGINPTKAKHHKWFLRFTAKYSNLIISLDISSNFVHASHFYKLQTINIHYIPQEWFLSNNSNLSIPKKSNAHPNCYINSLNWIMPIKTTSSLRLPVIPIKVTSLSTCSRNQNRVCYDKVQPYQPQTRQFRSFPENQSLNFHSSLSSYDQKIRRKGAANFNIHLIYH